MDNGYECHLTFPLEQAQFVEKESDGEWKFSKIDGDPVLGQRAFCYLTSWSANQGVMEDEMRRKIDHVVALGFQLVRAKIEHIIYDQRY